VLEEVHIAGLGVIEDAWLSFHSGLNVLTGETGTGKTMVTVAVGLALGARVVSGMLRPGADRLAVEARFGSQGEGASLEDLVEWVDEGEGDLILARTVRADGRSAGRINGRMAPASSLEAVGARLVEIHGQNQAERLTSPAAQAAFLDRFAGPAHLSNLSRYRDVHTRLGRARADLRWLEDGAREREREKDLLRHQVREIEAAAVVPGELSALAGEDSRLTHAERILSLAAMADAALGEDDGAADRLRAAADAAKSVAALDPASRGMSERLASLAAEADDVAGELRGYRESVDLDPARLDRVRERIQAIRSLERKYGDGEEGILGYLAHARTRLSSLHDDDGERDALRREIEELTDQHRALGNELSAARAGATTRLAKQLTAQVRDLGMPGAGVDVMLVSLGEPGGDGFERIEFMFSGGPNQPGLPLAKVASGGELSRTMLACRSVLADLDDVATLVFDELDAGIGGRAAAAVGRRLAGLARHRQVLVVTHLAQIAAHSDRHFLVTKEGGTAAVRPVEGDERIAEVARMLSGSTADVSLEHARELLVSAGAWLPERPNAGARTRSTGTSGPRRKAPAIARRSR
jgi:DNA repair protein RecN (Recombination protein N)